MTSCVFDEVLVLLFHSRYEDLVALIPQECAEQWYIVTIMDKLKIFGIVSTKLHDSSDAKTHIENNSLIFYTKLSW